MRRCDVMRAHDTTDTTRRFCWGDWDWDWDLETGGLGEGREGEGRAAFRCEAWHGMTLRVNQGALLNHIHPDDLRPEAAE